MGQLTEFVGLLLMGEDEAFLGSTFPVNEAQGMYLGAAHTIPPDRTGDLRIMALLPSGFGMTKVKAVEGLGGQSDVVVLQAEDGLPPLMRLAAEEAFLWDEVQAAGYPEMDIRVVEAGERAPGIRALAGSVTRKVEAGESLGVKAPAYEVSFPIPTGMSGGPVYGAAGGVRQGLIGVCLGNISATSVLSFEVTENHRGHTKVTQETRLIEYGLVANLHRFLDSRIALADKSLGQLMGFEAVTSHVVWQAGRAVEPQP